MLLSLNRNRIPVSNMRGRSQLVKPGDSPLPEGHALAVFEPVRGPGVSQGEATG